MDIRLAPEEVDGVALTGAQKEAFVEVVSVLVTQARHPLERALQMAEGVFKRKMYEQRGGAWRPREVIQLGDAHGSINRSKFWKREQREES